MENSVKAIGVIKSGGKVDALGVTSIPRPSLNPLDILVEVKAVSTNPVDGKKRKGSNGTDEKPVILGYDASGIVVEIGSEVKSFKKGDEVYYAGSIGRQGTNSKLHAVDSRIVGKKPSSLSHSEAAGVPLVSLTAWEGLLERAAIPADKEKNKGKTLLVVNGAGGVGSLAIQIGKQVLGLTVIATASRKETVDFVKDLGADHVINHRNNLAKELEAIGIKSVDYAYHCHELTSAYVEGLAAVIRPFGKLITITMDESLNIIPLFRKSIDLVTELMFTRPLTGYEIEGQSQILDEVSKLIDSKVLKHTVTSIKQFNLENLVEAHNLQDSGVVIGKLVLDKVDEF